MALSKECVHIPHSKDADGKHHVFGETVLAPTDTQYEKFWTCIPLLKLADGKLAVTLGPSTNTSTMTLSMFEVKAEAV